MYALQQIKHTHGIWDEWGYNGEKVNLLTICISLPALSHTYTHTHQPTAVPKTSYHTATSSLEAHTLGRWVRCTLSVAVRPQWSCSGATAPAPRLKSGGRRTGATVWGVFEEDTEKLVADFCRVWLAAASVESIMANKAQQPPHLHLAEVTASQFLDIWKHFDSDGRILFPLLRN